MQYFGGKSRTAKDIVKVLESYRRLNQPYLEPFIGGGWVMALMTGKRYGVDKNNHLIAMYNALKNGWTPPTSVSKEDYENAKNENCPSYLKSFIGFGCSFSGKWFGGYAKNNRGDNYCLAAHKSLMKKFNTMKDVVFVCKDYKELNPKNLLIYCDPPYQGTTQYGAVGDFNSNEFWDTVRVWSKNNTVIVSEYQAPDDFKCIWERKTNTEIRNKENKREERIEKLFIICGS